MKYIVLVVLAICFAGCTTINVTADNGARVEIKTDRNVNTLPVNARDNTIPLSAWQ